MKTKYEKLDALIMGNLSCRSMIFNDLFSGRVKDECRRIVDEENKNSGLPEWKYVWAERILDRRLQALRKAGKIHFLGSGKNAGWALVDKQRGA